LNIDAVHYWQEPLSSILKQNGHFNCFLSGNEGRLVAINAVKQNFGSLSNTKFSKKASEIQIYWILNPSPTWHPFWSLWNWDNKT